MPGEAAASPPRCLAAQIATVDVSPQSAFASPEVLHPGTIARHSRHHLVWPLCSFLFLSLYRLLLLFRSLSSPPSPPLVERIGQTASALSWL